MSNGWSHQLTVQPEFSVVILKRGFWHKKIQKKTVLFFTNPPKRGFALRQCDPYLQREHWPKFSEKRPLFQRSKTFVYKGEKKTFSRRQRLCLIRFFPRKKKQKKTTIPINSKTLLSNADSVTKKKKWATFTERQ